VLTQVAMAVLGVVQVAELREAGAFVEGAMLAGHSVGECNALAAVAGVLPLEAVLA
jgi:fatty acid synthase